VSPPTSSSRNLYDAVAQEFDATFAAPTHRKAYDTLAGEYIERLLPASSGVIVDAGCGTGRWPEHWLKDGREVIGIEDAPEMLKVLRSRHLGPRFRLVAEPMESAGLEESIADLVVAMGSVQYASHPAAMIQKFARWAKPGGFVCVHVDSLMALVLELLRLGRTEEALTRLRTRRGVIRAKDQQAELFLYDAKVLREHFLAAGLVDFECRGLLVTSSAWGADQCAAAMANDPRGLFDLEHQLSAEPIMADAGRHIIAWARRPSS
jgi:SAM-dependent methyltransferase